MTEEQMLDWQIRLCKRNIKSFEERVADYNYLLNREARSGEPVNSYEREKYTFWRDYFLDACMGSQKNLADTEQEYLRLIQSQQALAA